MSAPSARVFTGEFGVGALVQDENEDATAFFNIAEVSAGYQAGIEKFAYALFFMTDSALEYLGKGGGFTFGEEGLMGGLGLKGSKITRYHPK